MSSVFDLGYFGATFVSLIVILDPPGNLPIFLGLTSQASPRRKALIARKAALTAFGVLLVFALIGEPLLNYLHITMSALRGAGGLLLLIIGLQLVMGHEASATNADADTDTNIALVPLAVPLLAGPGVLVALLVRIQGANGPAQYVAAMTAMVAAMAVVWLTLHYAGALHRVLGESGTTLISRIAGLLCSAIAVQMIADAVLGFVRAAGVGS